MSFYDRSSLKAVRFAFYIPIDYVEIDVYSIRTTLF